MACTGAASAIQAHLRPCCLISRFGCGSRPLAPHGGSAGGRRLVRSMPRPDRPSAIPPAGRRLDNRLWRRQVQAFREEVGQTGCDWWGHSLGHWWRSAAPCSFPGPGAAAARPPCLGPTLLVAVPHGAGPPGGDGLQRLVVICSAAVGPSGDCCPQLIARTSPARSRHQSAYRHAVMATANCVS